MKGLPRRRPRTGGETGSATIWVVSLCSVVWLLAGVAVVAGQARVARHQAAAAADLAALAAADRASSGEVAACTRAATVSRANGADLLACGLVGPVSDVTVRVPLPSPVDVLTSRGEVFMRARAGPYPP